MSEHLHRVKSFTTNPIMNSRIYVNRVLTDNSLYEITVNDISLNIKEIPKRWLLNHMLWHNDSIVLANRYTLGIKYRTSYTGGNDPDVGRFRAYRVSFYY